MKLIVELIGPSGIGKSTFLRNLRARGGLEAWPDLISVMNQRLSVNPNPPAAWQPEDLFLLDRKLTNTLVEQFNVLHRYQHLQNRYRRMHYDVILRGTNQPHQILDDDHVCHLFTPEVVSLAQTDSQGFSRFIGNRAFIFLKRPAVSILSNIRARELAGEGRAGVSGVSDAVIVARTRARIEDARALKGICRLLGAPVLSVNLDESLEINHDKVGTFLNELSRNR